MKSQSRSHRHRILNNNLQYSLMRLNRDTFRFCFVLHNLTLFLEQNTKLCFSIYFIISLLHLKNPATKNNNYFEHRTIQYTIHTLITGQNQLIDDDKNFHESAPKKTICEQKWRMKNYQFYKMQIRKFMQWCKTVVRSSWIYRLLKSLHFHTLPRWLHPSHQEINT